MAKPEEVALVVDLDGTLSRSDTFHEAILRLGREKPLSLLRLAAALPSGKVAAKRLVADAEIVPAEELVLNEDVTALIEAARADGRKTILVTASDDRQAQEIARATGLFDEAYGTGANGTDGANLSGSAKAAFLVSLFGERGFDYVGDAPVDAPVWQSARRAITVGAGAALRATAERANSDAMHLGEPRKGGLAYLRALRPYQWSKNLLIFLPLLAAHDVSNLGIALAAFAAFCLTASSVYVINDLLDLPADRQHPRKRNRPFACGAVPLSHGVVMAAGLVLAAGLIGALFAPGPFILVLAAYFLATLAYSLFLKRKLVADIMVLACLYTLRIIAGGAATGIPLSPWMLAFSMFLFLSLAAVKRQAELVDQVSRNVSTAPGRAYETGDMQIIVGTALSSAHAAVLVFALYLTSDAVTALYASAQILWLICPILLYWLLRMVMVTSRGRMKDDPIVFASQDPISFAAVILTAVIIYSATF
ncbi:UbiA family prenyltransferase [Ovoidimarina sediminis]|uniref:UbiA family prenyltransferase n=1 Tax=Ovoidimarina sediminis TaxID=3079856 RepID=UPI00292F4978|nr:UbiA family prenyltransferase [Rhodophyticola sp. MJ-SS7]